MSCPSGGRRRFPRSRQVLGNARSWKLRLDLCFYFYVCHREHVFGSPNVRRKISRQLSEFKFSTSPYRLAFLFLCSLSPFTFFSPLGKYQNGYSNFLLGLSVSGSPTVPPVCSWLDTAVADETGPRPPERPLVCGLHGGHFISFAKRHHVSELRG